RTIDLRAMGGAAERLPDARIRMPATSAALLLSSAVVALAGLETAMLRPGTTIWIAFVPALVLVAFAALRPYFAVVHGALRRRRRASGPARVREVAGSAAGSALVCAVLGLAALVAAFVPSWLGFLGTRGHGVTALGTNVLWVVAPIAGAAAAAAAFWLRKDAG